MISGEFVSIVIFIIGCYTIMVRRDIVRTSIGVGLMSGGVVLYLLTSQGEYLIPPIGSSEEMTADPLPQALMITNIIIGLASTSVALGIFLKMLKKYDTARWDVIHKKQEEDL